MIVNKKQLEEIFGISQRSFTEYQKDPAFPYMNNGRGSSNEYDTKQVYEYLLKKYLSAASRESSKERLDRIRADREFLAYAKDIKELVPAEEVETILDQVVTAIKTTLLNSASKLKTELDALYNIDIDPEILDEHNRSTLSHLSAVEGELGTSCKEGAEEV